MAAVPDEGAAARPLVRQQVDRKGRFPDQHVRPRADKLGHRPHHFLAGGVAQRMDDPAMAVPAFQRQSDLAVVRVEVRPIADQLADAVRRLADDHVDDPPVAKPLSGGDRIGRVTAEIVQRIEDAGDPPLRIGAVGLQQAVLRDDDDPEARIDGQRGPDAGDAAADDQHVRKSVRNPFRVEPNEIAAFGGDHNARQGGVSRSGMAVESCGSDATASARTDSPGPSFRSSCSRIRRRRRCWPPSGSFRRSGRPTAAGRRPVLWAGRTV